MRKRGHCIALYIISLVAITFGVVLSIAIPTYIQSNFRLNRKYNKIVQRVNEEIKNSHYIDDYMKLSIAMSNYVVDDTFSYHTINAYLFKVSGNLDINHLAGADDFYTLNIGDAMYITPIYQQVKERLQLQLIKQIDRSKLKQLLSPSNGLLETDKFDTIYVNSTSFKNILCTCIPFQESDKESCDDTQFDGIFDTLYEEGHVCDPERKYKTLLTPKTIKMVKEFIEDYNELEN